MLLVASEPTAAVRPLDPDALGDHLDRLFRAAWSMTGSRADAEDLVQETYARVLAKPRTLRGGDELGYLLRSLRHTWISLLRTRSRRPRAADDGEERLAGLADSRTRTPHERYEAAEVYRVIAALPDHARDVLALVDVAGLGYGEAAAQLDVPVGTVMSRLSRARARVAVLLEGDQEGG